MQYFKEVYAKSSQMSTLAGYCILKATMRKLVKIVLMIGVFLIVFGVLHSLGKKQNNTTRLSIGVPLKVLASQKGIEMGTQIAPNRIDEKDYREVLLREFSFVVIDGPTHWGFPPKNKYLRPSKDTYYFDEIDKIVTFAKKNNLNIQFHHLVWGQEKWLPEWLKNGNFSQKEYYQLIEDHIKTVMGRYKGQVKEWTVVNEPFTKRVQSQYWGDDFWYKKLGNDYISFAFRKAREQDPNAVLILNDFNNQEINAVSNLMYDTVKTLKAQGVPIDGVGMQMHLLSTGKRPDKQNVLANIKRFGNLGVKVYITEFDVDITQLKGSREEKLKEQAQIYKDMMEACVESRVCVSFATFGFTDKETVFNYLLGKKGADPLPFDENYNPKPAYVSLQEALR